MKITDIKPYPVWVGKRNQMIVKVETDEGIYGWGESGLSGRELAVAGAVKHYREFLIGREIPCIWARSGRKCTVANTLRGGVFSPRPSRQSTLPFTILQAKLSMSLSISSSGENKGITSLALPRRMHRWDLSYLMT